MNTVEVLKLGIKAIPNVPMIIAMIELIVACDESRNLIKKLFLAFLNKYINTVIHITAKIKLLGNVIYCSMEILFIILISFGINNRVIYNNTKIGEYVFTTKF